jgi:hypothetical protein
MSRTRKEPTEEQTRQLLAKTYVPYSIHFIGKTHYVADVNGRLIKAPKQAQENKMSRDRKYKQSHDNKQVEVVVETEKASGRQEVVVKVSKVGDDGKVLKFPNRIVISPAIAREIGSVLSGM